MAGNLEGGKRAAETNKRKYGADWYQRIGSLGGKADTLMPKGFAAAPKEKRIEWGRKGGRISRRTKG